MMRDLVDDRALSHLEREGVSNCYDFLVLADKDIDTLLALPYVTARTVEKVREAMSDG